MNLGVRFDTQKRASLYFQMVSNFFVNRFVQSGFGRGLALAGLAVVSLQLPAGAATVETVPRSQLQGTVVHREAPVDQVRVYAFETLNEAWKRTETDDSGRFLFDRLAPGLYKLIAYKAGFVPAVLMLTRGEVDDAQYVQIQLSALENESDGEDFWSARRKVPQDVLRDIQTYLAVDGSGAAGSVQDALLASRTQVQAFAGTDDRAPGNTVSGGSVAVDGVWGSARFELAGDYREFGNGERSGGGASHAITLAVDAKESEVEVTTLRHQLDDVASKVALERHSLGWTRDFGRAGRSSVSAEFTEQDGFFRTYGRGRLGRIAPQSSRQLQVRAEHAAALTGRHSIRAGVAYEQTEILPAQLTTLSSPQPYQRLDFFSEAGFRIKPRVLVEYGLVTTLRDGALSFVPRGGAVVQLNDRWSASTTAAQRVYDERQDYFGYRPVLAEHYDGCTSGQKSCYQVEFARVAENDNRFAIAATHREFDETLQLFFDEDLLDRFDTLYLVDGDALPEVEIAYTSRWSPTVVAQMRSSVGVGGGGMLTMRRRRPAENTVQYFVTSLDTQFETTDTGLYIAFQQLEQGVDPIRGDAWTALDVDKLQLRLTQDLRQFMEEASVAVRLSVELARGVDPNRNLRQADDVRQRLTGGVAVTF